MPKIHEIREKISLDRAQMLVGGYVERIKIDKNQFLLVDEDGLIKNLPINEEASLLAGQVIVGDAVLLIGRVAISPWR